MDQHLMISILGFLTETEISELKEIEVEEECIFTLEADIEDDELLVQAEQEYRLQIRGDYLVQCVEGKIIGGLKFDTECQFEIKRFGFQDTNTLPKPYAFMMYMPDDQDSPEDQFAIKLGVEIQHHQTLENFAACLERKEVIQINCYSSYKTLQRISRTPTSCIYCVERLRDNKVLAIKAVYKPPEIEENEEINPQKERQIKAYNEKSMIKEYMMMRKLPYRSICRVQSLFQAENSIFLVMECLKMNLLQYIQRIGFKSAKEFRELIFKLFQAVDSIHERNIMHRDLKLENIMMREVEPGVFEPVLIDFGLAQYEGVLPYAFVRCGTPGYAAPEVLNSSKDKPQYTKQCDIFSLGCVLHCLLLGRILFEGPVIQEVIEKNRKGEIDETLPLYSTLQSTAKDLLFSMLEKDPSQRITIKEALVHSFFNQQNQQSILPKNFPIKLPASS